MNEKYVLDGHNPVVITDLIAWTEQFEKLDRRVRQETANGLNVSTVFLGIDHSFGTGLPILFETMIFGLPKGEEYVERCSTWEEAEAMHKKAVKFAKSVK